MKVRLRASAKADVRAARAWYRLQSEGLDQRFMLALDACMSAIERFPKGHPVVYRGARRAMLPKFPYGVFYLVDHSEIVVVAVYPAARDQQSMKRRLR